ncbi:hypothetical protein Clacol_006658 [Clathrus columnatus]|uniref:Uncharacterized protein n=1 Tax=Clathrus columnatus TaxID=1419009 RepID=A0AAV5AHH9_9AGAM|nr:hypothetical protein Clacol_006658 [Clathrus columnatus]
MSLSSSSNCLQPSPFPPDRFLSPSALTEHNTSSLSEGFIKKRPLDLTEELVAGRMPFRSSRPRRLIVETPPPFSRLRVEEIPKITRTRTDDLISPINTQPMTPPPKSPSSRISLHPHDVPLPFRPSEFVCHSPAIRRHAKKTRSLNSRRLCTPPSPIKSPSRVSPHVVRSRTPLGRWTPPVASTCIFYTPESADYPITPTSNTTSVVIPISTHCPWTISSTSSSPYSLHSD